MATQRSLVRLFFVSFVFFTFFSVAKGAGDLTVGGYVTGEASGGVSLALVGKDSKQYSTSCRNGRFTFTGLSQGTYTLKPEMPDYEFEPESRTIYLTADDVDNDFTCVSAVTNTSVRNLTTGSVVRVYADETGQIDHFTRKPKLTIKVGGKKIAFGTISKVSASNPMEYVFATLGRKIPLYDPKSYRGKLVSELLSDNAIRKKEAGSLVVDSQDLSAPVELDKGYRLVPPTISELSGSLGNYQDVFVVKGMYFGAKLPKVQVEYTKDGAAKYKKCKVLKNESLRFMDAKRSANKSCMKIYDDDSGSEPIGYSEVSVEYPKLDQSKETATGYVILDNGVGMVAARQGETSAERVVDAEDDAAAVLEGGSVVVDVLWNDLGDDLFITKTSTPSHGTVSIDASGLNLVYTPAASFSGSDSFTYTVSTQGGVVDTAEVSVDVLEESEVVDESERVTILRVDDPDSDIIGVVADGDGNGFVFFGEKDYETDTFVLSHLAFKVLGGTSCLIGFDEEQRWKYAIIGDLRFDYSNYTGTTVDSTLTAPDGTIETVTLATGTISSVARSRDETEEDIDWYNKNLVDHMKDFMKKVDALLQSTHKWLWESKESADALNTSKDASGYLAEKMVNMIDDIADHAVDQMKTETIKENGEVLDDSGMIEQSDSLLDAVHDYTTTGLTGDDAPFDPGDIKDLTTDMSMVVITGKLTKRTQGGSAQPDLRALVQLSGETEKRTISEGTYSFSVPSHPDKARRYTVTPVDEDLTFVPSSQTVVVEKGAYGNLTHNFDAFEKGWASFTATPSTGESPLEVFFDAGLCWADYEKEYKWAIDKEVVSEKESFTREFADPGTYTVSLTITVPHYGVSDTCSQAIEVADSGVISAEFTASPSTGEAPLDVTLQVSSPDTDKYKYYWSSSSGWTDQGNNVKTTVTFDAAGTYTVTLEVYDAESSSLLKSGSKTIQVEAATGLANFTISTTTGTAPLQVDLKVVDPDTTKYRYDWVADNGWESLGGGTEESVSFTTAGTYTVTLSVYDKTTTSSTALDSETKTITVTDDGDSGTQFWIGTWVCKTEYVETKWTFSSDGTFAYTKTYLIDLGYEDVHETGTWSLDPYYGNKVNVKINLSIKIAGFAYKYISKISDDSISILLATFVRE